MLSALAIENQMIAVSIEMAVVVCSVFLIVKPVWCLKCIQICLSFGLSLALNSTHTLGSLSLSRSLWCRESRIEMHTLSLLNVTQPCFAAIHFDIHTETVQCYGRSMGPDWLNTEITRKKVLRIDVQGVYKENLFH